jgi:chaperonin GroEL (HSP60 family)
MRMRGIMSEPVETIPASMLLILKHPLETPARQIAESSGVDGGVVMDRMVSGTGAYGFDASRGTYVDLVDAGIIDPTIPDSKPEPVSAGEMA